MDQLDTQCQRAKEYPLNFADSVALIHGLESRWTRLNAQERRLFCVESRAALDFLEYGDGQRDWWNHSKKNIVDLRNHLLPRTPTRKADPSCRQIFISAPSSRDKLNITREMLAILLTYHQIMPDFVEFLFPFGKQARAQDFHFTAFRQRTRLRKGAQGLEIRDLKWSGRDFQVCYNLKSVECSSTPSHRPWSIRHCAVSHSFDVETGRSTWIMIKGNKLMQQRMVQATSHRGLPELRDFRTVDRSFAASLVVHQILCAWLAENWRWYINSLEERYLDISRRTIVNEVNLPANVGKQPVEVIKLQRRQTDKSEKSVLSILSRNRTPTAETLASVQEKGEATLDNVFVHRETGQTQPLPPGVKSEGDDLPEKDAVQYDSYGQQEFSFRDLQDLNFINVKAAEASLVIDHGLNVLLQLIEYYQYLFKLRNFPQEIKEKCVEEMADLEMSIKGVEMELKIQVSRIKTLQCSVSDCKTLLQNILDFQNTQSNKTLAKESRASTFSMENMTKEMNDIALRTQTETVSMKIITLVTLFFLPGTFISTLMSTGIFQNRNVKNPGPNPFAKLSPLQFYLAASLPLTLITLTVWASFHWWEKRKEINAKFKSYAERHGISLV